MLTKSSGLFRGELRPENGYLNMKWNMVYPIEEELVTVVELPDEISIRLLSAKI